MTDRQNLDQFRDVMSRAYDHQNKSGVIQGEEKNKLDKLFQLGPNQRVIARDGRVLFFWRTFRRRVAYQYARAHRLPVRAQLDWSSIWQWILDNWQTVIRTILFLVPFVI
jgi:hypothetical protein